MRAGNWVVLVHRRAKMSDSAHSQATGELFFETTFAVLWKTLSIGHNICLVCVGSLNLVHFPCPFDDALSCVSVSFGDRLPLRCHRSSKPARTRQPEPGSASATSNCTATWPVWRTSSTTGCGRRHPSRPEKTLRRFIEWRRGALRNYIGTTVRDSMAAFEQRG